MRAATLRDNPSAPQWRILLRACLILLLTVIFCSPAFAQPRQADVFRSIQDNVAGTADSSDTMSASTLLLCIAAVAGVVLLISVISRRHERRRSTQPQPLNHPRKLLRQIRRRVGLRRAEIRQLKALAVTGACESPLVLLLCPSLLARTAQENPAQVDRAVLQQLARKLASGPLE